MNRAELFYVLTEMVEHAGVSNILDEVIASMSTDELQDTVKHLDQHLFDNHYTTNNDE